MALTIASQLLGFIASVVATAFALVTAARYLQKRRPAPVRQYVIGASIIFVSAVVFAALAAYFFMATPASSQDFLDTALTTFSVLGALVAVAVSLSTITSPVIRAYGTLSVLNKLFSLLAFIALFAGLVFAYIAISNGQIEISAIYTFLGAVGGIVVKVGGLFFANAVAPFLNGAFGFLGGMVARNFWRRRRKPSDSPKPPEAKPTTTGTEAVDIEVKTVEYHTEIGEIES